jgi:hypothetical protein
MSVIINELDVVAAPPAEAGAAPRAQQPANTAAAAPPSLSLEELRNLLRHQAERAARLRAH